MTGECQGQCPDGPPTGYRWGGPGCRIGKILYPHHFLNYIRSSTCIGLNPEVIYVCIPGNVAYNRRAVLRGGHHIWKGLHSLLPGLAVDGNLANDNAKCARTAESQSSRAWWYVDLGSTHTVTQFTLLNKLYGPGYTSGAGKNLLSLEYTSDITKLDTILLKLVLLITSL